MGHKPSPLRRPISAAALFLGFGCLVVVFTTSQMRKIDDGYRAAIERQATAAYILANANRLLVSERDDIAEMLIDNTAAGSAADLSQLQFDQASFDQSLSRAMALVPEHADGIAALQRQANKVLGGSCQHAISLGAVATQDAAIMASQQAYLDECAPYFPAVVKGVHAMQELLRNERNAQIAEMTTSTSQQIRVDRGIIIFGFIVFTAGVFYCFRPWFWAGARHVADLEPPGALANPTPMSWVEAKIRRNG